MTSQTTATSGVSRRLRVAVMALAALLTAALVGLAPATVAHADDSQEGWIRLTHLSPDTPAVNVELTSLSNSRAVVQLQNVGYGDISNYERVEPGTYVASMTPAGGDAGSTPAITQTVEVEAGKAYTVAAVGLNAELKGTVLTDDLQPAKQGEAKIRLLQASVSAPVVTVTAMGGPTLAQDAQFATATGYAAVPAGIWSVTVTPQGGSAEPVTTDVEVRSATVNTVIVLDREGGGINVMVVKDAEGVATMPQRGVDTGDGGMAEGRAAQGSATPALALLAVAGVIVAAGAVRRRLVAN